MYKVSYDVNGKIIGFYSDKIQYSSIPEPYIYISNEKHNELTKTEVGKEWYYINGEFVQKSIELTDEMLNNRYIPSETNSMKVFARSYLKANPPTETEEKIALSGLYETWVLGKYEIGDIRNYAGQTWECHQAHDNAIYPDINPNNPQTWATFWHPLHGKTKETARPWVKPWAGTTDMYHVDEYMIFTDGKIYKCLRDTVYSPDEYSSDWNLI